ncbi:MAG: L,D-transpeptidase family protein [Candidatus Edwardsbacteria bacterium]|nr:L,D-transpeptidase family protein [Candidatus Edwardsbacteria bacterium]
MLNYKGKLLGFFVAVLVCTAAFALTHEQQLRYAHVQAAYRGKEADVKRLFATKGIDYPPKRLFIRVFKREQMIELWAAAKSTDKYGLITTYNICASSGELGPKRRRGDGQVPEGFYHINHFNPESSFYLSLGVSYPNRSDIILKTGRDPGGAIYIHGDCVTIGCIPITDDKIKELYVIALDAAGGQAQIPVHIFPAKLDSAGFVALNSEFKANGKRLEFWTNLKQGYDIFERERIVPKVGINGKGEYVFSH